MSKYIKTKFRFPASVRLAGRFDYYGTYYLPAGINCREVVFDKKEEIFITFVSAPARGSWRYWRKYYLCPLEEWGQFLKEHKDIICKV